MYLIGWPNCDWDSGYTVNIANISLLKYFRTAWLVRKLNAQKYIYTIDDNVVQGRSSENYLTRKIIARNILDTKYSRFTVMKNLDYIPRPSRKVFTVPIVCRHYQSRIHRQLAHAPYTVTRILGRTA